MAYYAALVSAVQLLKEITDPENKYPQFLFRTKQITSLYGNFSNLQKLLEDYKPNDQEAVHCLETIGDAAYRAQDIIELHLSKRYAYYPVKRSITYTLPPAADQVKRVMESQISDQMREPHCLEEIVHIAFRHFVSACHNTDTVDEKADSIVGKGYRDFLKLKDELDSVFENGNNNLFKMEKEAIDSIAQSGFEDLLWSLKEDVVSVTWKKYQDIKELKEHFDLVAVKGYENLLKLMEEVNFIVGKGHHDLVRLKEEVDSIVGKGYQALEILKAEVDSIVEKGYQGLKKWKEEFGFLVGKGYLGELNKEVGFIVEKMIRIKKNHTTHEDDFQVSAGSSSTEGWIEGTTMVGFEEYLTRIASQLCGQSSKREVISIIGMGGIGKTTLARNLYYDNVINGHFDCRVWVTVSQSYYLRNILLAIVNSLDINKQKLHGAEEEELGQHIYQYLYGKRFLVIMDDVWDTKVLDDVRWIFPKDSNESRIVITTRESEVASYASTSDFIYQIPLLNEHQSWNLFCKKVLCPPELKDIGRSIVRNCRGLPLVVVVVAGLLSNGNMTRHEWEEIARSISSSAAENDKHFLKILSLSYKHLPHHLKPCFLYFGGIPEDYEVSVSKLITLWVAERFLRPVESKSFEEVAEEYLEDLVKRNLVSITKWRSNGKSRCCSIHDLLRDLCSTQASSERFLHLPHKNDWLQREDIGHIHRLFIHPGSSSKRFEEKEIFSHVRSVLSFCNTSDHHFSLDASHTKLLRVLDAPSIAFDSFFAETSELSQLRYLALLRPQINIPSVIFKLQNLQTLIFVPSSLSLLPKISLPSEIWMMPRLRHVMIDKVTLPATPNGGRIIDKAPLLGMLQTLFTVVDFTFNLKMVEMIPSLTKLKLQFLDYKHHENAWEKFGIKYLVLLHQLETLDINLVKERHVKPFPTRFSFPLNLKKLSLQGCMLPWKDMVVVGSLPNLQVLKLKWDSFVGEEWEPKEGEFLKLKFLYISLLHLKHWRVENARFPCLEHLQLVYCFRLEEIPSEIGDFPNLKLIEMRSCNPGVASSALNIQEEQSDIGNDILQVRIH